MSSDRQLNYVNDLQNRDQNLYYIDDASELNNINLKENDKIYAINDNKLFQMEIVDQEEELSGSIVSFNGRNNTKIKSLVMNIKPQQDLHGYDSPWPAGGGANFLPPAVASTWIKNGITLTSDGNGRYHLSGTSTAGTFLLVDLIAVSEVIGANDAVHFRNSASNGNVTVTLVDTGSTIQYAGMGQINRIIQTGGTTFEGKSVGKIQFYIADATTVDMDFAISLEHTAEVTAYSPYSNICPISGWTSAEIEHMGKNLLPLSIDAIKSLNTRGTWNGNTYTFRNVSYELVLDSDGKVIAVSVTGTPTVTETFDIPNAATLLKAGEYTISGNPTGTNPNNVFTAFINGKWYINNSFNYDGQAAIKTYIQVVAGTYNSMIYKPMIRFASDSDATFAPYTGNQISVTFPKTVYGGYADITSGNLLETYEYTNLQACIRNPVLITIEDSSQGLFRFNTAAYFPHLPKLEGYVYCNMFKGTTVGNSALWSDNTIGLTNSQTNLLLRVKSSIYAGKTAQEIYDMLADVYVALPLFEPLENTFNSHPVSTLYGTNNIWADTGDITVKIAEKGITAFELEPHI